MSAIENLVRTVLKSFDVDPEAIKKDVLERVAAFEKNVEVLNATLTHNLESLRRIEAHLGIEVPTAKPQETINEPNGHDSGASLLTPPL